MSLNHDGECFYHAYTETKENIFLIADHKVIIFT